MEVLFSPSDEYCSQKKGRNGIGDSYIFVLGESSQYFDLALVLCFFLDVKFEQRLLVSH